MKKVIHIKRKSGKKKNNIFEKQAEYKAKIANAPLMPNSDMSMRQTQT
jgi:hypothetical protein